MTTLRQKILDALEELGVECAGKFADKTRWSRSDLATDLAAAICEETLECRHKRGIYIYIGQDPKVPLSICVECGRVSVEQKILTEIKEHLDKPRWPT